ncbi:nucleoside hydrolase-like domain-containing protein (plasmid) [Catenovulum sp. SX2]|uniref:nucleoside hydrolase-like domain-containing protein n=1 Tax=Catenovulum sp. SX2 TaxID=3398614 RepID=UPI003F8356E0
MKHTLALVIFTVFVSIATTAKAADKANIWVLTDLSDPTDRRVGGHPQNDPDDLVSMASLLLMAEQFNIAGISIGSTDRKALRNPMPFFNDMFVKAYTSDINNLKGKHNYQSSLPVFWSSLTNTGKPIAFEPNQTYINISHLTSIQKLADYASAHKVYVLNWGPMTEAAILVKHLISTENYRALQNIHIISHWTMSYIAQGTPEAPYKVANCTDDVKACHYLHQQASSRHDLKLTELGSIGQSGLVNGSIKNLLPETLENSQLAQIFNRAKFYYGKPDQSDAATMWVLVKGFEIGLNNFQHNGQLTQDQESYYQKLFLQESPKMMAKLITAANKLAGTAQDETNVAAAFSYVYKKHQHYELYAPYQNMQYWVKDANGTIVLQGNSKRGNQQLDLPIKAEKSYTVTVQYKNWHSHYWL